MRKLHSMLLSFALSFAIVTQTQAVTIDDYDFQQERMQLTNDSVIVLSTFDNQDHVTAYTHYGVRLWNAPFHAKILSWRIAGDLAFVFSKDRKGTKTYITCLNRYTGELIWQKP